LHRPFCIDLDSANGTTVNDEVIPASRYYELKSGDGESPPYISPHLTDACAVLKFAFSTREYVLLAET
jgi:smad nuclear-interacting protein 1